MAGTEEITSESIRGVDGPGPAPAVRERWRPCKPLSLTSPWSHNKEKREHVFTVAKHVEIFKLQYQNTSTIKLR